MNSGGKQGQEGDFRATLTSKGQITIPIEVRSALGLRQGDRVMFRETPGSHGTEYILTKEAPEEPFSQFVGRLRYETRSRTTDALMERLRGPGFAQSVSPKGDDGEEGSDHRENRGDGRD